MKKVLAGVFIIVLLVLGGCGKADKQVKPNQEELMNQYQVLINEKKPARDLTGFIESNKTNLSRENLDKTVLKLIEVLENGIQDYDNKILSLETKVDINKYRYQDLAQLRNIREDSIINLLQDAYSNGYKLAASEGSYYFEVDYSKILNDFGSFALDDTAGYLVIMSEEYGRHTAVDAALVISPDELANRIVRTKKFIDRYPAFTRIEQVKMFHRNYLKAYLLGLDNTPLFDFQSKKAKEYFLESYRNTVDGHKGTELAAVVEEHLALLEKSDYTRSEEIMNFVNRVTQT